MFLGNYVNFITVQRHLVGTTCFEHFSYFDVGTKNNENISIHSKLQVNHEKNNKHSMWANREAEQFYLDVKGHDVSRLIQNIFIF